MRVLWAFIASSFLLAAPAWAAISGAYDAAQAASADICAHRCADDSLCMMWVYRTGSICELRASVTSNLEAVAAGVSPRAPAFAQSTSLVVATPAPPPAPAAPPPRRAPHHSVALLGGPETDRSGLRPRLGDTP